VGRTAIQNTHPKFRQIVHSDVSQLTPIEASLEGFDACFFCLGVSSIRMSEGEYTRVTHDLTLSVARTLVRLNPVMTFVYVSAQGTDGSGKSSMMWARVRGKTENEILALPFKGYAVRPGFIQPLHGIRSKTAAYQLAYTLLAPIIPLTTRFLPKYVTTTERLGRAMLHVAANGYHKKILESSDINQAGTAGEK